MKLVIFILGILLVALGAYTYNYTQTYNYHCETKGNFIGVEGVECNSANGGPVVKGVAAPNQANRAL